MDRLIREKKHPKRHLPSPIPQYWDEDEKCYKKVQGNGKSMLVRNRTILAKIDQLIALYTS